MSIFRLLCQAKLAKPGEIADHTPGAMCRDYMEHWAVSTQGMLFCYLHWQKHLKTDLSKASAALAFDLLIDSTLKSDKLVMMVSDDAPAGSIPSAGVAIHYSNGVISDASHLCDDFDFVKKALGRIAFLMLVNTRLEHTCKLQLVYACYLM